ncbi:MAG: ribonuclease Z [Nitrospirae bacterium]|nr:ribonuclease Z [Candidatus Manganitrophaceae bacterium]
MKPLFHPRLVHDPFGDPGLYVSLLFERRGLLFDLGDLRPLSARMLLKTSHVFITHAHMDHFIGFDQMLRICLGREKALHLFGPLGITDQVSHKLSGYTWNLVENYPADFHVIVTEVDEQERKTTRFRTRSGFRREETVIAHFSEGVLVDEPGFRVRSVHLDHKIPSLGYTLEEKVHINILKNRLEAQGLPVGPWLKELKDAILRNEPDDLPFRIWWKRDGAREGVIEECRRPLGALKREIIQIAPGQKISYVTDVVYHSENARRIIDLVRGSDILFIESAFLQEDADRAAEKYHLTTAQAGLLARDAGVKEVAPFHFSAKYNGEGERHFQEVREAFKGKVSGRMNEASNRAAGADDSGPNDPLPFED